MKNFNKNNRKLSISTIFNLIFLVLVVVHGYATDWHMWSQHAKNECTENYSLINPIFACSKKHILNKSAYTSLKNNLEQYTEEKKMSGEARSVAIFFRDLEAGPTLGINEREKFIPASLLKLPHVMAVFQLKEDSMPNILEQKLMFPDYVKNNMEQNFKPEKIIIPNTPYTVRDVIDASLIYSDNGAENLLFTYVESLSTDTPLVENIYKDLGIMLKEEQLQDFKIDAKSYSTIFRMLYNSSFFNPTDSEIILEILSKSSFTGGIRAGVPKNITISHKFGERTIGEIKQLHSCGIVYYPDNPYLLCVMTEGDDFYILNKIISEISKMFYEEVDSRRLIQ